jgi:hypothetical protein
MNVSLTHNSTCKSEYIGVSKHLDGNINISLVERDQRQALAEKYEVHLQVLLPTTGVTLASNRTAQKNTYQTTTLLAVVLLLLILFVSAAYVVILPAPDPSSMQDEVLTELQTGRDQWNTRRPRSYRYVVERSCSCPRAILEPYVATEENGLKTAAFPYPIESEAGETLTSPPSPVWIDDLFTLIEQSAINDDVVAVKYDASFGFPKAVDIKHNATNTNIRYELRDFEVLEYR